ncbi:hypothetical protein EYF80_039464 [Liparis tanakae]|uniref:Secreted protein n=1 Tax=Liparis tanakae TaxID=230148 RepID=A0A4Z2G9V2_9TELE|nr:hypothetical protein EYF80_039464 [Liparis tanakae]
MRTWRRRKNFAFLLLAFRVWCVSTAAEHADTAVLHTQEGSSPDEAKRRGEAPERERYGTTVPLLLKGEERRPFFQLTARFWQTDILAATLSDGAADRMSFRTSASGPESLVILRHSSCWYVRKVNS